eukprot:CAMPEP_0197621236 /NCGR_PEP_ID=MMETSP1338-20131121/1847_1 /TAXON_ID=43686 ORGANISM="Pelagodinium beii, Strain RCC1491" /NCGR_SAMPLE_ID=MMETSP1338 /ASSEMBLY_ACC=CAM_ASM_000754 /LENGTH=467 /DNA_ID=CAMNT_0043190621 /DNA_START=63 /DNA_END=1463 /DNA_ORIENTATION=+
MTEFKRTTQAVEEIEGLVQVLLGGGSDAEVQRLGQLVGETGPTVEKLSKKAAETDPNKQIYGPNMREKIRAMAEKWLSVESLARDVLAQKGGSVAAVSAENLAPPPQRPKPSTGSVLWQPPQSSQTTSAPSLQAPQSVGTATSGTSAGSSSAPTAEERRRLAAKAAEARMAGDSGSCSASSASKPVAMDVDRAPKAPLPVVARMDALLHLVHCVFLGHGFLRGDDSSFTSTQGPYKLRYTHEKRPPIVVTYVPVQRHLIAYANLEGEDNPARATVQIGMAAAAVQAKIDYLLLYPLLYRQLVPTLPTIPPEVLFGFLTGLALPALAAVGASSRSLSAAVFDDDVLWYRIACSLPQTQQLLAALQSVKQKEERNEALPRAAYRLLVRTEVQRARTEVEERNRRRAEQEAMQRNLRDPLMIGQPRRPQRPFPGGGFGIGGPDDIMPGGGFFPPSGGGGGFGGRRDPFGG